AEPRPVASPPGKALHTLHARTSSSPLLGDVHGRGAGAVLHRSDDPAALLHRSPRATATVATPAPPAVGRAKSEILFEAPKSARSLALSLAPRSLPLPSINGCYPSLSS